MFPILPTSCDESVIRVCRIEVSILKNLSLDELVVIPTGDMI